jgi:signal transduction histidine kinase
VRAIYADATDLVWLTTVGGGVSIADLNQSVIGRLRSHPSDPNSLSQNDVRSVLIDQSGAGWIGTQSGGLNRWDRKTSQVTRFTHDPSDPHSLANNTVYALYQDSSGVLWVGSFGGLHRFDAKTQSFTRYVHDPADPTSLSENTVYSIFEDSAGQFWIGTWDGLNRMDRETGKFTVVRHDPDNNNTPSSSTIAKIVEDEAGNLWIGATNGLNRLDPRTETWTRYVHDPDDPTSLSPGIVYAIAFAPSGEVWIGGDGGLNKLNPATGEIEHYDDVAALEGASLAAIYPMPDHTLWIVTIAGLIHFDPATQSARTQDMTSDGWQPSFNYFASAQAPNHELLLGSTEGLFYFNPNELRSDSFVPTIALTQFQLANQPVAIGPDSVLDQSINVADQITLSYLDRIVSFGFTALSYRQPQANRYRYYLEGFENDWIEVDSARRFVTYTNLDPGRYVFHVTGSNADGLWNPDGRSVELVVAPPWWQSYWARALVAGLFAALIVAGFRVREQSIRRRNQSLETQVALRTQELVGTNLLLQREIDERRRAERALQNSNTALNQRVEELSTLNGIAQSVTTTADLHHTLASVAQSISELFQAEGVEISLFSSDGAALSSLACYPRHANGHAGQWKPISKASIYQEPGMDGATNPLATVIDGSSVVVHGEQELRALSSAFHIIDEQQLNSLMTAPLTVRNGVTGVVAVGAKNTARVFTMTEVELLETIAGQIAGVVENMRLLEEESHLRRLAEQRGYELATLLDVAQQMASTIELEPLLDMILDGLKEVVDFAAGAIMTLEGDSLVGRAYQGPLAPSVALQTRLRAADAEFLFDGNLDPIVAVDLRQEPALQAQLRTLLGPLADLFLRTTRSWLAVPLYVGQRRIGVLALSHYEPGKFAEREVAFVTVLAGHAAVAVLNAQIYLGARVAAADEERSRLARELHDAVTQTLFAASLIADSLPEVWEHSPDLARSGLNELQLLTRGALAEMRTLLLELRPASLLKMPLSELLRPLCDAFSSRSKIQLQLQIEGKCSLPPEVQVAFYRVAQEGLNNILKHAAANMVRMELRCRADHISLTLVDDGVGFDATNIQERGLGLTIMRERMDAINAKLQVDSAPGYGTRLRATWTGQARPPRPKVRKQKVNA